MKICDVVFDLEKGATTTIMKEVERYLPPEHEMEFVVMQDIYSGKVGIPEADAYHLNHYGWARVLFTHDLDDKWARSNFWGAYPLDSRRCASTVHHVPHWGYIKLQAFLPYMRPLRWVTSDRFWQQILHQFGLSPVACIPQIFHYEDFPLLPLPTDFTVGWFGMEATYPKGEEPVKRWPIAREAVRQLHIPHVDGVKPIDAPTEHANWVKDPLDFYRQISCYIVTGYTDTGPIPPQEALLCGRPVITTETAGLRDIVKHGVNGLIFDGTVWGLCRALQEMQDNFEKLCEGARATVLPDREQVAGQFLDIWKEVAEQAEAAA